MVMATQCNPICNTFHTLSYLYRGIYKIEILHNTLTASVCIGCTANRIPAIIAKLFLRPATMMQTRVNNTQTMACIKILVK